MIQIISPDDCISIGRRGVGFLIIPGDRFVNGYEAFLNMKTTDQNRLWTNFRYWISQTAIDIRERCHRYNKSQYGGRYDCFQFEIREGRFYGFLSNPDEQCKSFYFFTAIHHLNKYRKRTEEMVLKKITDYSRNNEVNKAISKYIIEKRNEEKNERKKTPV